MSMKKVLIAAIAVILASMLLSHAPIRGYSLPAYWAYGAEPDCSTSERPCDQDSDRFCRISVPWARGFPFEAYGEQDPVDCSKDHNYVAMGLNTAVASALIVGGFVLTQNRHNKVVTHG